DRPPRSPSPGTWCPAGSAGPGVPTVRRWPRPGGNPGGSHLPGQAGKGSCSELSDTRSARRLDPTGVTGPVASNDVPAKSRMWRPAAVVLVCVIVLAVGAYLLVARIRPILTGNGCQAGTGHAAVSLEPEQASIAATIAGVAHQRAM